RRDQCAIGETVDPRERQRCAPFARCRLDHLYADQFLRRINPEIRAPWSSPGKSPDRSRYPALDGIGADREAKSKVVPVWAPTSSPPKMRVPGGSAFVVISFTASALSTRTPSSSPPFSSIWQKRR